MTEPQPEHGPAQHWGFDTDDMGLPGRSPDPREIEAEIKRSLGIGVPRVRYQPGPQDGRPDVSGLAEGLGLK
jgi:hypothetical protein